jgi:hypothetical protein
VINLKYIYNSILFFSTAGLILNQLLIVYFNISFFYLKYLYIIGFPLLLFLYVFKRENKKNDFFFISFLIIISCYLIFNFLFLKLDIEKTIFYIQILVIQIFYFLLFKNLEFNQPKFYNFLFSFSCVLFVFLYLFSDSQGLFLYFNNESENNIYLLSYQGIGRVFLIMGGLILNNSLKKINYLILFICLSLVLFINGGRSEFALFLFSNFLLFILNNKEFIKNFYILFFLLFLIFSIFLFFDFSIIIEHRIFSLLNVQNSLIESGRENLNNYGYITSLNNPILGKFGSWKMGQMPHNFWSISSDFGFLIFIGYFLFIIIKYIKVLKRYYFLCYNENFIKLYFFSIWIFGLLTSFWYGNEFFGISLGVLSASKLKLSDKPKF